MSDFFVTSDNPDVRISEMASRRAEIFFSMTETAAKAYGIQAPVLERVSDVYYIHSAAFCNLVECVFLNPINLLAVWASYAAGMYEAIKGRKCCWYWMGGIPFEKEQNQAVLLPIVRLYIGSDLEDSKMVFGPKWLLEELVNKHSP